jgi:DNA-binding beta-propeller fold protein YncE
VPFHAAGADPGAPVIGLGGTEPYVDLRDLPAPTPDGVGAQPAEQTGASRAGGRAPRVYARTGPGMLSETARRLPALVWVADPAGHAIGIIDQRTYRVVGRVAVGGAPRRVVPSWDMRTLWLTDGTGDALVPVDPATGRRGRAVPVTAPDDLYFTPDGRTALVMAGRPGRIDFRDPHTMRLRASLRMPCGRVHHADFSAGGTFLVASCGSSGRLLRVDPRRRQVTAVLTLRRGAAPRDVRLSPDGAVFYVADPANGGVWVIDAALFSELGFIRTGPGADGLQPSRDGRVLYVANTGNGTISLIDFATRRVTRRWRLPGGDAPGLGGVSADGKVLWLTGRSHGTVYAISTETGLPIRRIKAGARPYSLCVLPQPGRYSLGHTGNFR